jgi:hypothetical protein
MLPDDHDSASSGEEDAPESFSLVQSKRSVQEHDSHLKKIQTAAKQKKKEENRERDKKLNEQSKNGKGKGKGKEVTEDEGDAVARMERAMREAEEELDSDAQDEEVQGSVLGEGEDSSEDEENIDGEDREMDEDEDEDEDMESSNDGDILTTDHKLPDHLFSFAANTKPSPSSTSKHLPPARKAQKQRSNGRKRTAKDLIIGQALLIIIIYPHIIIYVPFFLISSRAMRTLSKPSPLPSRTSLTIPTPKVRKFIHRSLGLKGGKAKAKGWERRAGINFFKRMQSVFLLTFPLLKQI